MMQRDIYVLLETTSPEIFDEQAKCWPGLVTFRALAWKCKCGEENCFMYCCQAFGHEFSNADMFGEYLDGLIPAGVKTMDEMLKYTDEFYKKRANNKMH